MAFWIRPQSQPASIQPAQGYAVTPLISTSRDVVHAVTSTRSGSCENKPPAEVANASTPQPFKTLLDTN